jgi:hypothetical protein
MARGQGDGATARATVLPPCDPPRSGIVPLYRDVSDSTPIPANELSPTELELIDRIVAMFPGDRGASLRRALTQRNIVRVGLDDSPEAQALADRVFTIREARKRAFDDSLRAHPAPQPVRFPVTIVLVDQLSNTSAGAEVVHRAKEIPSDLILLPATNPTVGAFSAAVRDLGALHRWLSTATPRDSIFAITDSRTRDGAQGSADRRAVAQASNAAPVPVPGMGTARACWITLTLEPPPPR